MKKAELLTSIENKSLGIANVTEQETGKFQNGKTFTKYNANVLVKEGASQNFKNIPFTVIDEGAASEDAFLTQGQKEPQLDQVRQAAANYMDGLVGVIRYKIGEVNEDTRDVRVNVVEDQGNGIAAEKTYLVYKNGTDPITHVELV